MLNGGPNGAVVALNRPKLRLKLKFWMVKSTVYWVGFVALFRTSMPKIMVFNPTNLAAVILRPKIVGVELDKRAKLKSVVVPGLTTYAPKLLMNYPHKLTLGSIEIDDGNAIV